MADTNPAHVVVTGTLPDYDAAIVFNATGKDAPDNREQAEEYVAEQTAAKPWLSHTVLSKEDFDKSSDPASVDATEH